MTARTVDRGRILNTRGHGDAPAAAGILVVEALPGTFPTMTVNSPVQGFLRTGQTPGPGRFRRGHHYLTVEYWRRQ
jgi:hypothetical protein